MILFVFEYRPLENDFLLVEASLLVPCSYVSRIVPYKYLVFKEKRKDSKEEKYLWDHLVSWGVFKNRCLQIPKDRCVPEGVYLFIYLFTFYFLQLHESIMSVILALFDILIPNDILQILHRRWLALPTNTRQYNFRGNFYLRGSICLSLLLPRGE